MTKGLAALSAIVPAILFGASCAVHQADGAPPLTGPSDFSTSITVTATPSTILRDGQSQSSVVVRATDPNGQPLSGVTLRMDIFLDGSQVDFGTLAARTIVTGSDGRASTIYTAPAASAPSAPSVARTIRISASPVGNNAQTTVNFSADITLMPPGVILGQANFTPDFTFTPTTPTQGQAVTFDASATKDPTNSIRVLTWDFGDGTSGTGVTTSHVFTGARAYTVTLTGIDELNRAASKSKVVTVAPGAEPSVDFTISPSAPATGQQVTFVATAKSGVPGHEIVRYDWVFGANSFDSGSIVTKTFDTQGAYSVTLTVRDDLGITKTISKTVTVGLGLSADFTFSPTDPTTATTITFDASPSVSVLSISSYDWDFGDASGGATGKTVPHKYAAVGTYVVRLTITDSGGHTASTNKTVAVK